jgi:iron complex outermembrane receptor protein
LTVVFRNRNTIEGYHSPERQENQLLNIGYGTVHRDNSMGAVVQIDVEDVSGYADLQEYMQGKVAGVSIEGGRLLIRGGMTSLLGDTEALIMVDGVPVDNFAAANAMVNPQNVESISVLKDASSTAIYGVRGTNGVVLITTKGVANQPPRR